MGDFIGLGCRAATLSALAQNLTSFGPAEGAPDWLLSAVWLCAGDEQFLASVSTEVLHDGFVARPLNIDGPAEFGARIEAEMPDIAARLHVRGHGIELQAPIDVPAPPATLRDWPADNYSTSVLVRVSKRESCIHRVACGLLFTLDSGASLLIGADLSTMAMVLAEDPELIDHYCLACEALTSEVYLRRVEG